MLITVLKLYTILLLSISDVQGGENCGLAGGAHMLRSFISNLRYKLEVVLLDAFVRIHR